MDEQKSQFTPGRIGKDRTDERRPTTICTPTNLHCAVAAGFFSSVSIAVDIMD